MEQIHRNTVKGLSAASLDGISCCLTPFGAVGQGAFQRLDKQKRLRVGCSYRDCRLALGRFVMNSVPQNTNHSQASTGLVQKHISHRDLSKFYLSPVGHPGRVEVYQNMVTWIAPSDGYSQVGGGKRGVVRGFSKHSRHRMIELLCKLDQLQDAWFWTLTYPNEFPTEYIVFKRDLDTFLKRLKRRWPKCGWLWRLEPQARGAPHYHLIVWNIPNGKRRVRQWLTLAWAKIAHQHDKYAGEYATRAERITSFRHAMHYASKYSAKVSDEDGNLKWGRWWGKGGNVRIRQIIVRFEKLEFCYMFRQFIIDHTQNISSSWHAKLLKKSPETSFTVFGLGARAPPLMSLVTYLHERALRMNEESPVEGL